MFQEYNPSQAAYIEHLRYLIGCKTITVDPQQKSPDSALRREFERAFAYVKQTLFATETRLERRFWYEEFDVEGRLSLVVSTHPTKTPEIGIVMHMDVVEAPEEMFTLRTDPHRQQIVIGRGVYDMKFAVVIALLLFEHLSREKETLSLALLITSDEEKGGSRGAKYIREQGYLPKLLIVPDGGACDRFASGSKGVLFFSIQTRGLTAHGAYPWRGINADNMLTRIKAHLLDLYPEQSEYSESETLTIGASHAGGTTPNNIPARASALFDYRFTSNAEETRLKERVHAIMQETLAQTFQAQPRALLLPAEEKPDITYSFLARRDVLQQDISHPDIQRFKSLREQRLGQAVTFGLDMGTNDASFWTDVPTILTMPLGGYAHTTGEWLDLQSLHFFARDIMQFIQEKNAALTGKKHTPTGAI